MSATHAAELQQKHCKPCHGETPPLTSEQARELQRAVPEWHFSKNASAIERRWVAKDFRAVMAFLQQVADLAEREDHHPDMHLTGYRHVSVELTTHAIGGLSENDFILAAKIDALPIDVKK